MFQLDDILTELNEKIGNKEIDDILDENFPQDLDTIGKLQYKLTCTCIQMWNNQEFLYAVRKMTTDEFIIKYGDDLTQLHRMVKRCCDLNNQRAQLMDAIDRKAVEVSGVKL